MAARRESKPSTRKSTGAESFWTRLIRNLSMLCSLGVTTSVVQPIRNSPKRWLNFRKRMRLSKPSTWPTKAPEPLSIFPEFSGAARFRSRARLRSRQISRTSSSCPSTHPTSSCDVERHRPAPGLPPPASARPGRLPQSVPAQPAMLLERSVAGCLNKLVRVNRRQVPS